MKNQDDAILEVLQGEKIDRWPAPRIIKIFIASTKTDFIEERRLLLENVGPDLQTFYDSQQIEVELVDVHFGASKKDVLNPELFNASINEIKHCYKLSKGCFSLFLIGNKYQPYILPYRIKLDDFNVIYESAKNTGTKYDLLKMWYVKVDEYYVLKDLREVNENDLEEATKEITYILSKTIPHLPDDIQQKLENFLQSELEQKFSFAKDLHSDAREQIVCAIRTLSNIVGSDENYQDVIEERHKITNECERQLQQFIGKVERTIPSENRCYFTVPWKNGGVNTDDSEHEAYLDKFKSQMLSTIKRLIDKYLQEKPELKSRKKIVQENFEENISHLTHCFDQQNHSHSKENLDIISQIEKAVQNNVDKKHSPIIIYGNHFSGKTDTLHALYEKFTSWFPCKLFRIVRYASATPRSSYNLEMLRILCQQISIALKLPEGFLPKDASFDLLYLNNWFQKLLKLFEERNQVLLIFIDDLHRLNILDSDLVSGMSWFPNSLPKNVYIVCTTSLRIDALHFNLTQKETYKNSDSYFELPSNDGDEDQLKLEFDNLEECFGCSAVSRLCSLITCSEYGLTEIELLEILMPTSNSEAVISTDNSNFNFAYFYAICIRMDKLLRKKYLSGKILFEWSHAFIKEFCSKRYLSNQESVKNIHTEISNMFFSEFISEELAKTETENESLPSSEKRCSIESTIHSDVTYTTRHIEEAWIHLLKSGDIQRLKSLILCNFDFLLAAIQTTSVSYIRCVLEHNRCYILDREIELIYYTIRKAGEVLTRDTFQLGTQVISWLRPVSQQGGLMANIVTSAMAWCDGFSLPLLVPMTDWLQPPLPSQSRTMVIPSVRLIEATPNGQHVVCVTDCDPQLWHIMSNRLVHTFKGHSGKILCLTVTKQSQYLLTGSEDISIIVWNLKTLTIHLKIVEHIAPVLSITSALNNSLIVSGGEDSSIIMTSLSTGKLVMKFDHHRGPVTSVKVTSAGDVLVSASQDGIACLWSLESFTLLNCISLNSPVLMTDVSADSVFLLAACADNSLCLRTLATGTELHRFSSHKSKVTSICLTQDSCRAVVGCSDSKVYIYDVHSGKLTKTLTGLPAEVAAVQITEKDDFLLTAGGNRVFFYPFRSADTNVPLVHCNRKSPHNLKPHDGQVTCIDISRDGQLAVSGSTDNLVNVWQLNSHGLLFTLDDHTATVTSVCFAPNCLFVVSGSEDKTIKIWGLTLGTLVSTFTRHQSPILTVYVMMDSSRVISSDQNDIVNIWLADNGQLLQSYSRPSLLTRVTNNMKYVLSTNCDNSLKIWSIVRDEEKYTVSHSEAITCFVLSMDSQFVITGSKDMSLKVWQVAGGKLSQVLIGHTDAVTCVAVSVSNKTQVISGSKDAVLIVWDINTGADLHVLSAHLNAITCVKLSGDGTIAVSGSEDESMIIWDVVRGLQLTSLQVHHPIVGLEPTSDFSRIFLLLKDTQYTPIVCLHNTPAKYVKLPTYCAPDKDIIENPKPLPKRQMRRLLKKEVSLDTYTWQKKYAHLTSNLVIPAVDERFKRRFSVSASMEEISKIPQNKDSQESNLPNKQGSLAQSQHFDQLEALWNKRSPPRRRLHQSLSKQSSLAQSQIDSSDEERELEDVC
ncbi:NACHT domain- and WD repeat-containing protein 1 [Agrilus planipennis]|uniref:NACHT domain- and WD repeat-containing protein 1 n=1 Tax=Agrilus planipennis TaxID=224129 RepID=A0A7F5R9P0_AGRPL|nr:NACHT domain- and WD repeat-containing protein 1 [Agrilus planipennis]